MLADRDKRCLRQSIFFGSLPEDVFDLIVAQASSEEVKQGDIIFQQDEAAETVYCVANGAVKLSVATKEGDDVVVEIFHEGASFAEALIFRDAAYPVNATALTDSRLVAVPRKAIEAEMRANPQAFPAVLQAAFMHLRRLVRQIEQLKATSGVERVAGFLLALAEQDPDQTVITIPYEKQVVASMLGIKPETLSRAFKRLEKHGLRVQGPKVEITNRAALEGFLNAS